MPQGHHSDGSSIQIHSAGGLYPFVLYAQDRNYGRSYGVLTPGGYAIEFDSYATAGSAAEELKAATEDADAFAFSVERLMHDKPFGQRLPAMLAFAKTLPVELHGTWGAMSKIQRVSVLLRLARGRRLHGPVGPGVRNPLLATANIKDPL